MLKQHIIIMFDFWEKIVSGCPVIEKEDENHDPVISTDNEQSLLDKISALEKQIAEMERKDINGDNLQN